MRVAPRVQKEWLCPVYYPRCRKNICVAHMLTLQFWHLGQFCAKTGTHFVCLGGSARGVGCADFPKMCKGM